MATAAERLLARLDRISNNRNQVADRLSAAQAQPLNSQLAAASVSPVSQGSVDAMAAQAANAGAPTSAGFVAEFNRAYYVDPAKQSAQKLAIEENNQAKRITALQTQLDGIDNTYAAQQSQLQATFDMQSQVRQDNAEKRQADRLLLDQKKNDDGAEVRRLEAELAGMKVADYPKQQELARLKVNEAISNAQRDDKRASDGLAIEASKVQYDRDKEKLAIRNDAIEADQMSLAVELLASDEAQQLQEDGVPFSQMTKILYDSSQTHFDLSAMTAAMNSAANTNAVVARNLSLYSSPASTAKAGGSKDVRAAIGLAPKIDDPAASAAQPQNKTTREPIGVDEWADGSPYSGGGG